jgi:hypothetical protein
MAIREYFLEKHGWSHTTIDSIWWQTYHKSLTKLTDPEKLVIKKFINNRLPTRKRENTYYKYLSALCPTCSLYVENEDHILQCGTTARQSIQNEWRKELTDYLSKSHTPKWVKHHISQGLFLWLETGRYCVPIPPTSEQDRLLQNTVTTQNSIGWQHFVRGRMTIEWCHHINIHLANQTKHKITAEQWGSSILTINWKYILQLWDQRNSELHGTSPEITEVSRRKSMIEEIQYIQSGLLNVSFNIVSLINQPTEELKKLSIQALEAYLYGAKIVAKSCRNKSHQNQPTLEQIIAQIPPQFHNYLSDDKEQEQGYAP